ncbi:glutathione S-transferase family protein [Endozoicomonas sp. SM1973]|uniref:Glutathione S-transferase family protein n=1 Tax=Spartinivicinus marinus TaxID=2994442 RepID=A0A853IIG8_9GAMM|nr:glutathione S-transferase family protein [Spartinivicinus marinus]MCX4028480.1 glutathione S-transferase family protein [Spartinivicinus marinus]NYZ67406.1 glutathione S-transferase family protein [Spartinivicinus marinus]
MITVYGVQLSPFVRKVLISLDMLELDYTVNPVSPMDPPEGFKKISPLGKVPALEDDGFAIADSTVICQYLNEKYGKNQLYPADIKARTKAWWLEEYADTKLAEVVGMPLFFERIVKPTFLKQDTNEQIVEDNIKHNIPPVLDYLESVVPETAFVCGALSVADLSIACLMINAAYADYEVDSKRWPTLSSYLARIYQQAVFRKYIESDKQILRV